MCTWEMSVCCEPCHEVQALISSASETDQSQSLFKLTCYVMLWCSSFSILFHIIITMSVHNGEAMLESSAVSEVLTRFDYNGKESDFGQKSKTGWLWLN